MNVHSFLVTGVFDVRQFTQILFAGGAAGATLPVNSLPYLRLRFRHARGFRKRRVHRPWL